MTSRYALGLWLAMGMATAVPAAEVSSIVACKPEGEVWRCAAWRQGELEVFRSETYISQVEFGEPPRASLEAAARPNQQGRTAEAERAGPSYTLQLLACRVEACVAETGMLGIPDSREVAVRRNGQLWYLLTVGEYNTHKAAQQAAAVLIQRYRLREKPWIRTLDSLNRQRVAP